MKCELCDAESDFNFNCLLPSFGVLVSGDVCLNCLEQAEQDMEIAVALIKHRALVRNIALPIEAARLGELAQRMNEPRQEDKG